jgi:hypothetical protein
MSEPKNVNFSVVNNSGRVMPTLWANHDTSWGDSGQQSYLQTNVQSGPTPVSLGQLTIVSRTDDFFTVMWTDSSNNLYGTPYNFKTETSLDGGYVQIVIQGATFQFFQDGEGPLTDPIPYIQYEVAAS